MSMNKRREIKVTLNGEEMEEVGEHVYLGTLRSETQVFLSCSENDFKKNGIRICRPFGG